MQTEHQQNLQLAVLTELFSVWTHLRAAPKTAAKMTGHLLPHLRNIIFQTENKPPKEKNEAKATTGPEKKQHETKEKEPTIGEDDGRGNSATLRTNSSQRYFKWSLASLMSHSPTIDNIVPIPGHVKKLALRIHPATGHDLLTLKKYRKKVFSVHRPPTATKPEQTVGEEDGGEKDGQEEDNDDDEEEEEEEEEGADIQIPGMNLIYQHSRALVSLGQLLGLDVTQLKQKSQIMSARSMQFEHVHLFHRMFNPSEAILIQHAIVQSVTSLADPRIHFLLERKYSTNPSPGTLMLLFCQFFVFPAPQSHYLGALVAVCEAGPLEDAIFGPVDTTHLGRMQDTVRSVADALDPNTAPRKLSARPRTCRMKILLFAKKNTDQAKQPNTVIRGFLVLADSGVDPIIIEEDGVAPVLYAYCRALLEAPIPGGKLNRSLPRGSSTFPTGAKLPPHLKLRGLARAVFPDYQQRKRGLREHVRTTRPSDLLQGLFPEWSEDKCRTVTRTSYIQLAYIFARHACREGVCGSGCIQRPIPGHTNWAHRLLLRDGHRTQRALFINKDKHYTIRQDLSDTQLGVAYVHSKLLHPASSSLVAPGPRSPVYSSPSGWGSILRQTASNWLSNYTKTPKAGILIG